MNCKIVTRPSFVRMALLFACLSLHGPLAEAGDIYLGNMKANKILFLGNSITYHGAYQPYEQYGWVGPWGMAASEASKDYVHVLMDSVAGATGARPDMMVTNIAEFELNYATYDIPTKLQAELAYKPDIVIVALGENVQSLTQGEVSYGTSFANLLTAFAANDGSQPTIFTRSSFWADAGKDGLMETATADVGGTFIDISALDQDPLNRASAEPYYHDHAGILAHPGDRGMNAIAGSIFDVMESHSVPEPGSIALLLTGLCGLLAYVRRNRG